MASRLVRDASGGFSFFVDCAGTLGNKNAP